MKKKRKIEHKLIYFGTIFMFYYLTPLSLSQLFSIGPGKNI